jgi:phosphoribosylamine--glycine ligase
VKVLLVGSGAREHALAWRLARSPTLTELHAAPGNPGIAAHGHCHPVRADDTEGLLALARTLDIDLVVIGPEAPLVAGVGDALRLGGLAVFGPSADAARIEGSKTFAKEVMAAAGVPTARRLAVPEAPCVVKADGLTAGKGVYICRTAAELADGLRLAAGHGGEIVAEELLEGPEVSLFALCDGQRVVSLGAAQDFKRIGDGDEGPNTGGMGAYAPLPWLDDADELIDQISRPVIEELARRGSPFVGCLFAGLMLTPDGPRVLEFNCRFGDPETQVLMPRVDGDLVEAFAAAAAGDLGGIDLRTDGEAAVTVVIAGPEYPARSDYSGAAIAGIDDAETSGAIVFHGGTALHDGRLVTNGGRILSVTGRGMDVGAARRNAYAAVEMISFDGSQFRHDIAAAVGG